jgi:hypothetical protein
LIQSSRKMCKFACEYQGMTPGGSMGMARFRRGAGMGWTLRQQWRWLRLFWLRARAAE